MNSLLIALAALALAQPQIPGPASLPPPPPLSVATTSLPAQPPKSSGAPSGSICECGYTYCASVLMKMSTLPLLSSNSVCPGSNGTFLDHRDTLEPEAAGRGLLQDTRRALQRRSPKHRRKVGLVSVPLQRREPGRWQPATPALRLRKVLGYRARFPGSMRFAVPRRDVWQGSVSHTCRGFGILNLITSLQVSSVIARGRAKRSW